MNGFTTHASSRVEAQYGKHLASVVQQHNHLENLVKGSGATVLIDGQNLSSADLVAASCRGVKSRITADADTLRQVDESVEFLTQCLQKGKPVYGISTGFGGSADTRTNSFGKLQQSLLQHQHVGILLPADIAHKDSVESEALVALNKHSLPRTAVRATLLIRCNSLLRGHSAVRLSVIATIVKLLNLDFIPVIPLRGSISASGDLTPLSYIAGALEGNPGIFMDCRTESGRELLPANEALRRAGIEPTTLGPKEGLGIMNGTAVSCAAATLALHQAQYIALLTQALTGMCTDALRGSKDNYHPFIAASRPHPGQIEAAANITCFLHGSKFAGSHHSDSRMSGLYQDGYALRTSTQWIAPQLEDLCLASQQLEIEINSTTDNPLIDPEGGEIFHGGNFQAASVTSATEKTRLCLQMFAKLLFAQNSEVINPKMNKSLPPNLCFDDPSLSVPFKGVDINMAAYMSEIAFLANPVSSHVQNAEMGNQAVNSLALISARYTMDAVEVVSMMCALHLYTLCQALDLQAMYAQYMQEIAKRALKTTEQIFGLILDDPALVEAADVIQEALKTGLREAKSKDLPVQAESAALATVAPLMALAIKYCKTAEHKAHLVDALESWKIQCTEIIKSAISEARIEFASFATTITPTYLGHGSKVLYNFIRNTLGVSLHKGLIEHATVHNASPEGITVPPNERVTIGDQVSKIYAAIRSGQIHGAVIQSLT